MAKDNSNVEGYAIGNQTRAAEIKAALAKSDSGNRHKTQGDTNAGTGRGGCSK